MVEQTGRETRKGCLIGKRLEKHVPESSTQRSTRRPWRQILEMDGVVNTAMYHVFEILIYYLAISYLRTNPSTQTPPTDCQGSKCGGVEARAKEGLGELHLARREWRVSASSQRTPRGGGSSLSTNAKAGTEMVSSCFPTSKSDWARPGMKLQDEPRQELLHPSWHEATEDELPPPWHEATEERTTESAWHEATERTQAGATG
ncbi:hypothetical protein NLG97_g1915 [Lecanicillium saksenae]|uniref:Uncharacterized protein n=1 Tax=Lecanicillium saksenae TaxID=468837 RepID=A0ACC1R2G4_9HYPO|nr:hypothetical protein NLG97_g1915 [Lecanicillium saksenae]